MRKTARLCSALKKWCEVKMKKSYLYASITVVIWATLAPVVKLLLNDIPSFEALTISSTFAFVFLLIVNIISGAIKLMKTYRFTDYLIMAGLGFIGLFMYSALYYFGIAQLSSQEACILNYLWPVALIVFSCLILKEHFTGRKALAVALSFAGIVVVMMGKREGGGGNLLLGSAACILAAVSYGLFSVLNKKKNLDQSITMMVAWFVSAVGGSILCTVFHAWSPMSFFQVLGLIYLGIMAQAAANLFWAIGINYAKNTALVANFAFLVPFLSVLVSTTMLHEPLSLSALAALVLIVSGILIQSGTIRLGRPHKSVRVVEQLAGKGDLVRSEEKSVVI